MDDGNLTRPLAGEDVHTASWGPLAARSDENRSAPRILCHRLLERLQRPRREPECARPQNDTAANVRLAINIVAAYAVGDDPKLSWSKVENVLAQDQEYGTFRLLQGFIALTGMLLQEFEFNVNPPVAPQTMLQKLADRLTPIREFAVRRCNRSVQLLANLYSETHTFVRDLCADLVRPHIASLSGQHSTAGSQKNG